MARKMSMRSRRKTMRAGQVPTGTVPRGMVPTDTAPTGSRPISSDLAEKAFQKAKTMTLDALKAYNNAYANKFNAASEPDKAKMNSAQPNAITVCTAYLKSKYPTPQSQAALPGGNADVIMNTVINMVTLNVALGTPISTTVTGGRRRKRTRRA